MSMLFNFNSLFIKNTIMKNNFISIRQLYLPNKKSNLVVFVEYEHF